MRKFLYLLSILFAISLFGDRQTNVKVVVIPMGNLSKTVASEINNEIVNAISQKSSFNVLKNISPEVLKEMKTELFNGNYFKGLENLSADAVVFVKSLSADGKNNLQIRLVNTETGELFTRLVPFDKKDTVGQVVLNMLIKQFTPGKPLTNVKVSGNNYWVKVVAKGKGPNKGSIGKKIALMDAKRRAVEQAVGAVVSVKVLPEQEKQELVSKTQGTLKYKIVSQKPNGKFYEVIISAEVQLPEDMVKKYPNVYFPKPIGTGHKALTQQLKSVTINWETGELIARGSGKIKKGENGELFARRAAIANAQGEALKALKGIKVKEEKKVSDFGMEYQLEGLVKGGVIKDEGIKGDLYWVDLKIPIYGIGSLTSMLIDDSVGGPLADEVKEQKTEDEVDGYTGIVIDARGIGTQPALIPEIYDDTGAPLYNLSMVDKNAVDEMGMASYVVEFDEGAMLENMKHAVLFPLLASNSDFYWIARNYRSKHKRYSYKRHHKKRKWWLKRRRQGRRPLRFRAVALPKGGRITTGAVISSRGKGKKLRRTARKLFKTARVVIITDPMVGGTEGNILTPVWIGGLW